MTYKPKNPKVDQIGDLTPSNGQAIVWNASTEQWETKNAGGNVTVATSPPASPQPGDVWVNLTGK